MFRGRSAGLEASGARVDQDGESPRGWRVRSYLADAGQRPGGVSANAKFFIWGVVVLLGILIN